MFNLHKVFLDCGPTLKCHLKFRDPKLDIAISFLMSDSEAAQVGES